MTSPLAPTPSLRASGASAGAVAGLAVAACAWAPIGVVAVVFLVLGCLLAYGWPRLLNLPSPRGTFAVLSATSCALVAVMLAASSGHRTRWAGAVLCLGLIGSFLHQLLRQDGRPRLVMSLAGTALGLGFLGGGSYLMAAQDSAQSRHLLVSMGAAVLIGSLLDGAMGATARRLEFAALHVLLGGLGGLLGMLAGADVVPAAITGAVGGLMSWAALRTTVTNATSSHTRAQLAAGAASALICCFAPYVVGQIF